MCSDNSIVVIPFQVWWMGESWSDYLASGKRRTKEKTEEKNKSNAFNQFVVVLYLMTKKNPSYLVNQQWTINKNPLFSLQNKEDGEKEEKKDEEKQKSKRGRPPLKSTLPSNTSCSLPKTPNSEGKCSCRGAGRAACAPQHSQLEPRVVLVAWSCVGALSSLHLGSTRARSARWKLILSILILATPRRQTRRSSGMFDSDRGSNGEWSQPCVCFGGCFSTFLKRSLVFCFLGFFYLLFLLLVFFSFSL